MSRTTVVSRGTEWRGYTPRDPPVLRLQTSRVEVYASLIMRDEEDNIPTCLPNMSEVVDGYIISDTGSTDESISVAKENIPGGYLCDVSSTTWVNYGYNRNVSLRRLERVLYPRMVEKTGLDLQAPITWGEYVELESYRWYALVTDLDNTFHHCDESLPEIQAKQSKSSKRRKARVGKGDLDGTTSLVPVRLDRSTLTGDAYFVESRRGGHIYRTNNILRIDPLGVHRWYYYRSIHEYVDNREPWYRPIVGMMSGCYIDYGCKGFRSRDIGRALKDVIYLLHDEKLESGDARNAFYLAQSYLEAGCHDKAREYYLKRAEMPNTWVGERYISYLKLAQLVDREKPDGDGIYLNYLFKGYELGLRRFEIAFEICDYFRKKEMHRSGWAYGQSLVDVTSVDPNEYLIDASVTNYKFWDVVSLAAFYSGRREESLLLTRRALAAPDLPTGYRTRLESNLLFIEESLRSNPPVPKVK